MLHLLFHLASTRPSRRCRTMEGTELVDVYGAYNAYPSSRLDYLFKFIVVGGSTSLGRAVAINIQAKRERGNRVCSTTASIVHVCTSVNLAHPQSKTTLRTLSASSFQVGRSRLGIATSSFRWVRRRRLCKRAWGTHLVAVLRSARRRLKNPDSRGANA